MFVAPNWIPRNEERGVAGLPERRVGSGHIRARMSTGQVHWRWRQLQRPPRTCAGLKRRLPDGRSISLTSPSARAQVLDPCPAHHSWSTGSHAAKKNLPTEASLPAQAAFCLERQNEHHHHLWYLPTCCAWCRLVLATPPPPLLVPSHHVPPSISPLFFFFLLLLHPWPHICAPLAVSWGLHERDPGTKSPFSPFCSCSAPPVFVVRVSLSLAWPSALSPTASSRHGTKVITELTALCPFTQLL